MTKRHTCTLISHILQQDTKERRHTTPERVSEDNDVVPFAAELDQLVHNLARHVEVARGRGQSRATNFLGTLFDYPTYFILPLLLTDDLLLDCERENSV